jgi:hypothetical protein
MLTIHDPALGIDPTTLDLDVGLVDAPRPADLAREAVPTLLELGNVAQERRMMVVWARDNPRSAIISTRSRKLSLYRRYQRTQRMMMSRSKWRPLKSSSTLSIKITLRPSPPGDYAPFTPFAPEPLATRIAKLKLAIRNEDGLRKIDDQIQIDALTKEYEALEGTLRTLSREGPGIRSAVKSALAQVGFDMRASIDAFVSRLESSSGASRK